ADDVHGVESAGEDAGVRGRAHFDAADEVALVEGEQKVIGDRGPVVPGTRVDVDAGAHGVRAEEGGRGAGAARAADARGAVLRFGVLAQLIGATAQLITGAVAGDEGAGAPLLTEEGRIRSMPDGLVKHEGAELVLQLDQALRGDAHAEGLLLELVAVRAPEAVHRVVLPHPRRRAPPSEVDRR